MQPFSPRGGDTLVLRKLTMQHITAFRIYRRANCDVRYGIIMLDKQKRVVWFNCLENLVLCLTIVYGRNVFIRHDETVIFDEHAKSEKH